MNNPGGAAGAVGSRPFDPFAAGSDAYLVPKPELVSMVVDVFRSFELVGEADSEDSSSVKVSAEALTRFVHEICYMYNDNLPFHNFHHGFTVFSVAAEYVRAVLDAAADGGDGSTAKFSTNAADKIPSLFPLRPVHILALLLAALCHDVDHPGLSNAFLNGTLNSSAALEPHPLAKRHSGQTASVVEAHHVDTTTCLLAAGEERMGIRARNSKSTRQNGANPPPKLASNLPGSEGLLSGMDAADAAYVMRLIAHAIMGTDLAVHQSLIHKLETLIGVLAIGVYDNNSDQTERGVLGIPGTGETAEKVLNEQVKAAVGEDFYHVIIQAFLHAADLCNPTLDFRTCAAWSLRLSAEFAGAAAREAAWANGAGGRDDAGPGPGPGPGAASSNDDTSGCDDGGAKEEEEMKRRREEGILEDEVVNTRIAPIAKGEVGFNRMFALPYFRTLALVYPPLQRHADVCAVTLDRYEATASAEHD